jgi:alpha-galactosidase
MMTLNSFCRDIKQFQDWGFDLLKCVTVSPLRLYLIFLLRYDNCAVPFDNITRENIIGSTSFSFGSIALTCSLTTAVLVGYTRMSNAIKDLSLTSGKPPILLSLCEWGRVSDHSIDG